MRSKGLKSLRPVTFPAEQALPKSFWQSQVTAGGSNLSCSLVNMVLCMTFSHTTSKPGWVTTVQEAAPRVQSGSTAFGGCGGEVNSAGARWLVSCVLRDADWDQPALFSAQRWRKFVKPAETLGFCILATCRAQAAGISLVTSFMSLIGTGTGLHM